MLWKRISRYTWPSRDREDLGHGQDYKYPHAYREGYVPQPVIFSNRPRPLPNEARKWRLTLGRGPLLKAPLNYRSPLTHKTHQPVCLSST